MQNFTLEGAEEGLLAWLQPQCILALNATRLKHWPRIGLKVPAHVPDRGRRWLVFFNSHSYSEES